MCLTNCCAINQLDEDEDEKLKNALNIHLLNSNLESVNGQTHSGEWCECMNGTALRTTAAAGFLKIFC